MIGVGLVLASLCASTAPAPGSSDGLIQQIFDAQPERFREVLDHVAARRVQVLVTEVGTATSPQQLVRHSFRAGAEYLYPASALKPAAAIAAIQTVQKLAGQDGKPVDLNAPIRLIRQADGKTTARTSLAVATRETLIVSSNRAYNQLYEIAGQEGLNRAMWDAGLTSIRLNHRLSVILSVEENRRTPPWEVRLGGKRHKAPARVSALDLTVRDVKRLQVGRAYVDEGELIETPMSFAQKNHTDLRALQDMLVLLVRPEIQHGLEGFQLHDSHRRFLLDALTTLPHESRPAAWRREEFDPHRFKPFLRGLERIQSPKGFRVVSKAGKAYGFRIDNAYVEERATGRAFFLTAGLHVDMDGTLNDNLYDYALADRFLANLAEGITRALLARSLN